MSEVRESTERAMNAAAAAAGDNSREALLQDAMRHPGSSASSDVLSRGPASLDSSKLNWIDPFKEYRSPFPKDGVYDLNTGDHLVCANGEQTLFTSSGDRVVFNDYAGTHQITGNIKSENTNKDGEATINFADGTSVTLGRDGFESESRNGQNENFSELPHAIVMPQIEPLPPRPHPWDLIPGSHGGHPPFIHYPPHIEIPFTDPFFEHGYSKLNNHNHGMEKPVLILDNQK